MKKILFLSAAGILTAGSAVLWIGSRLEKELWRRKPGMKVESFSEDTTVGEILKDPRFSEFSNLLALSDGRKERQKTIRDICDGTPAWKMAAIPYGLNAVAAQIESGTEFFHRFYSEEELQKDSTKGNTGLFYFPAKQNKAPFALVIPGGAYISDCVSVEGFPVAARLNEEGFHVFVLAYRTGNFLGGSMEDASEDMLSALRYIFSKAEKYGIDPENYAVVGFSAGGHLASTLGTDNYGYKAAGLPKPGILVLSYPLVDFKEGGLVVSGCRIAGLGLFAGDEKVKNAYVPSHLSEICPPLFIWAGKNDSTLPFVYNAQVLYDQAYEVGIPCELLAFDDAEHGLGIAKGSEAEGWLDRALEFRNSFC